ncbi:30S ribosomal protein S6 [Chloroflexota bacterium]
MTNKEIAEAENDQLRDYELVLIIKPDVAEEALEATLDNLGKYITETGGTVSNIDRWGKKKLAYPIKHFLEGQYVLTQFKMSPASGKQMEANIRISEDVLRHLLISLNAD